MKYFERGEGEKNYPLPTLELTERNLRALLAKLDDPDSARFLISGDRKFMVRAVPDEEHYADRDPGRIKGEEER